MEFKSTILTKIMKTGKIDEFFAKAEKAMDKAGAAMEEAGKSIEDTFSNMDKVFDDVFAEAKKQTRSSTSLSDTVEVYGTTQDQAVHEANQKAHQGYKLTSLEQRKVANGTAQIWVATLTRELKVTSEKQ